MRKQTKDTLELLNETLMTNIFEFLRKGHIISDNTNNEEIKEMFHYLDRADNYEIALNYFKIIGIALEKGEGYFLFSKKRQKKADIESKIKTAYEWIDILDFFKTFDNTFGVGTEFQVAEIWNASQDNIVMTEKLQRIAKKKDFKQYDEIKNLADKLVKNDFAVVLFGGERYKVLSSIRYLERLINRITIHEDETTQ